VSDNCHVSRNNDTSFGINFLSDIPESLYVDDYIPDYIQNSATLLIFSNEAAPFASRQKLNFLTMNLGKYRRDCI